MYIIERNKLLSIEKHIRNDNFTRRKTKKSNNYSLYINDFHSTK